MPANTDLPVLPALAALQAQTLRAHAQRQQEPDWLIEQRLAAWEQYTQTALPYWSRTDLRDLALDSIEAPAVAQGTTLDGAADLTAQGVVFTTLRDALQSHAELIRQKLGSAVAAGTHKFSLLNTALWQDGLFLYVPRNVDLELPLRVVYSLAEGNTTLIGRTLVVVERHARVKLIEEFRSEPGEPSAFASMATELILGDGAELHFVSVQHWGEQVRMIADQRAVLGRDAGITWVSVALGGQLQHINAETLMQGDGSHVNWLGATFGDQSQQLVIAPSLRHVSVGNESHMDFKTVVTDEAYSVFDGMIKIDHSSRGTSTRLEEHALHLGPKARSDSIPGLMIDTNDVTKAGHASTSGQIDEEQIFYLQARGIPADVARHMIVMGFFEPVLDAIPLDELREQIAASIEARI